MKKDLIKFYTNFRLFIFPSVIIISSLILIVFVIYPQVAKLIQNQKVESDLLAKYKFLDEKAQTLETLDQNDLAKKVGYALTAYPTERDFGNVLGYLQTIAAQSGFTIITFNVQQSSQTTGQIQSYNIRLEAAGPKSQLINFISQIESSLRIMKLTSMELTAPRDIDGTTVGFGIDAFFAPSPTNLGNLDSPLPELSEKDEELIAKLASNAIRTQPQTTTAVSFSPRGKANPFE